MAGAVRGSRTAHHSGRLKSRTEFDESVPDLHGVKGLVLASVPGNREGVFTCESYYIQEPMRSDIEQVCELLRKLDPSLVRHAEILAEAGFSEDLSDRDKFRIISDLAIPDAEWLSLIFAIFTGPAAGRRSGASFPKDLAWVDAIAEGWPSPIAYEYRELRNAVEADQIVAAVWQLKDAAEVLVKFPALVLARDVLVHGSQQSRKEVRDVLFGKQLTFGVWLEFLRTLESIVRREADSLDFRELIGAFFLSGSGTSKPVQTRLLRAINSILEFRNDVFGHGAYRSNLDEFVKEISPLLRDLNSGLSECAKQPIWEGIKLRLDDSTKEVLTGWQEIKRYRDTRDHVHHSVSNPLVLAKDGHVPLHLWPLIGLRVCDSCNKRDVFLYDNRSQSGSTHFVFLDYLAGHRLKRNPSEEPELAKESSFTEFKIIADDESVSEDFGRADFDSFLLSKASAARYLEPKYLHAPLSDFIRTHPKGVFWLIAPGHAGKSVLVNRLADQGFREKLSKSMPWLQNAVTCVFPIKREIQYSAVQLKEVIRSQLFSGFKRTARTHELPQFDIGAADPRAAFATFLHEAMALKPVEIDCVVICVDGLDELRPIKDQRGIELFLPEAGALPNNCYLLLTSRPLSDCPPFVAETLNDLGYGSNEWSQKVQLRLDGKDEIARGYQELLRQYYDREVGLARKNSIDQALGEIKDSERRATSDWSGIEDDAVRSYAQSKWSKMQSPPGSGDPVSLATAVRRAVEPFEAAFPLIVRKSGAQFAFVAFLTELIAQGLMDPSAVADLPAEDRAPSQEAEGHLSGRSRLPGRSRLYEKYLNDLEDQLAVSDGNTKHWDYVRRILIVLAADEEAHQVEAAWVKEAFPEYPYRGMSLAEIANRIGEPSVTYRLVSAIYSFQTLLAAWRQAGGKTPWYGLGLKDLIATLRALYDEEVEAEHRRVVRESPIDESLAAETAASPEYAQALLKSIMHHQRLRHPEIDPAMDWKRVLLALIASCRARKNANDHQLAVKLGVVAFEIIVAFQKGPDQEWALGQLGALVRAGYLQSYAAVCGVERALTRGRDFATAMAYDKSNWHDLVECAEQYCTFAEEIGGDPAALIGLIEQREFDRLFSAIGAQPDIWRGVLYMGASPLLLQADEPDAAWSAWQAGEDLAFHPLQLQTGIAREIGSAQAAKLIATALRTHMHALYRRFSSPDNLPKHDTQATGSGLSPQAQSRETKEPSLTLDIAPCTAIPTWARLIELLNDGKLGNYLFLSSLSGMILWFAIAWFVLPNDARPVAPLVLLGLLFGSMLLRVPLKRLNRALLRRWSERIDRLPEQCASGLEGLSGTRQRLYRAQLIRLGAVFKDNLNWQKYRTAWTIQQLALFLDRPRDATHFIGSDEGLFEIIFHELHRASRSQVEGIHKQIEISTNSIPLLKVMAKTLELVQDMVSFVSYVNRFKGSERQQGPSTEESAISALLNSSPAALGRSLFWTGERKDVQGRYVARAINYLIWHLQQIVEGLKRDLVMSVLLLPLMVFALVAISAIVTVILLVLVVLPIYFLPQLLITLFAARLRDPYHLTASVGNKTSVEQCHFLAEALRESDIWVVGKKDFLQLMFSREALFVVRESFFAPITKRRIRETTFARMMLLEGERMDKDFRSSFTQVSMRKIVSRLFESNFAGKPFVLFCMKDRKLLEIAKTAMAQSGPLSPVDVSEARHLGQLARVLPVPATFSNFFRFALLGAAASWVWWWCLRMIQHRPGTQWFISFHYGGWLAIAISVAVAATNFLYALFGTDNLLPGFLRRKFPTRRRAFWYQLSAGVASLIALGAWIVPRLHAAAESAGLITLPDGRVDWWFVAMPVVISGLLIPILVDGWRGSAQFYPSEKQLGRRRLIFSGGILVILPLLALATSVLTKLELNRSVTESLQSASQSIADGQYAAAILQSDRVIRVDAGNTRAYTLRCFAEYRLNDRQSAAADCDRAIQGWNRKIELNPRDPDAYDARGSIYAGVRQEEQAIADYTHAIALNSTDETAYDDRGNSYSALGRFEEALKDYNKAIELNPKDAAVYFNRGLAFFDTADFVQSAGDFARSVKDRQNYSYAVIWSYLANARSGNAEAASKLNSDASDLKSDAWPYPVVEMMLGRRTPEALLAVATTTNNRCEAHFYIGELHLIRGERAAAMDPLRTALDTCPKSFVEYQTAQAELKGLQH
jgi:lipoprotein NlpI